MRGKGDGGLVVRGYGCYDGSASRLNVIGFSSLRCLYCSRGLFSLADLSQVDHDSMSFDFAFCASSISPAAIVPVLTDVVRCLFPCSYSSM